MIKTVKTIREIYAHVRNFDLVITNDAPLCTALNSLIETPRLGPFAVTPHALARRFAPRLFEEPLQEIGAVVLRGARQLDMPLKRAHYHIERINAIHEHTGRLEQVRPFLETGPEGRAQQILDYLTATPTVYNAMESFDWQQAGLTDKRTAVIGPELFGQLDRRVLPPDYVSVPLPSGSKEWPLPAFHLFNTEKDIVDRIAEMVTADNADDIAIVLNISSNYLALLKARFESRNIPVRDKDILGDNLLVRSFLSLIDTALRGSGLRVRDIMPLAGLCGAPIRSEVRNHALEAFAAASRDPAFRKFHDLFIALPDIHCGDLIERLRAMGWDMPDILPELLDHLGFSGEPPTRQMWHELNYYLEHFETELARCKRGVLFVNCRNAAFINRPVCIFAGLDQSWTRHAENYPWVDAPAEEERHLRRFQTLLQQGSRHFYFSPLLRHNTPVIPCYYFNLLYDRRIEGFHDPLFQGRPVANPGAAPSPTASP
ncbi:hypothetical protein ACFL4W_05115, partial [Planctomycetota bacterium]